MKLTSKLFQIIIGVLLMSSVHGCENREVHANNEEDGSTETFKDMPVEGIETHFNKIVVDGVEYLILERDRNNPHEGFGFMAFRANTLLDKQDSILAYMQVQLDNQAEIMALLKETSTYEEQTANNRKIESALKAITQ